MVYLVVPELISCFKLLAEEIPQAVEKLIVFINNNEFISDEIGDSIAKALSGIDWNNKFKQFAGLLIEGVGGTVQIAVTAISAIASNAVKLIIGLIFAIYILKYHQYDVLR